jgi:VIT1/CCC1 family predicted Fe2+/Mn2+ transporter
MSMLRSALETLSVGGLAAVIAYVVENVLGGLLLYNFLRLNTD